MPNEYRTPGVYIEEIGALPPSVPAVETALPVFLGYVAEAEAYGEPVPIASLVEYERLFGGPPPEGEAEQWRLHEAIRLHYAHGGQRALVVPLGARDEADPADAAPFHAALDRIGREQGPTLLLAPDALLLPRDFYHGVAAAMLELCAALGDRMAILDIHGGDDLAIGTPADSAPLIRAFRDAVAPLGPALSYGAAYYPWLVAPDGRRMPPGGAMAGIYRQIDDSKGVWKAPANVVLDGGAVAAP
ncbi:MAG TPA: hypothetical protein VLK25_04770, partial [Allosphingosinicella sp.]|nr:hypothetical protein [Allosphingosinicella sp.]